MTATEAITSPSDAVRDRLAADAGFCGLLGLFDGEPACFAHGLVPPYVPLPFVVVDDPSIDKADDTKTTQGRDVTLAVRVYAPPGEGEMATAIAEAARAVLHRSPVDIAPYTAWMTDSAGPTLLGDRLRSGRQIRVRIRAAA